MGGGGGEDGSQQVVVVGRAEIDTRAPFRSVKEAVALFGEKVLAGELHAGRRLTVNENRAATTWPNHHHTPVAVPTAAVVSVQHHQVQVPAPATAELAEAKQELEKEREEKQKMAGCIQTLQEELSHAMRELKRLKAREDEEAAKVIDLQVDEDVIKFVEDEKQHPLPPARGASADYNNSAAGGDMQKKRYVTFADPPTADVVMEVHRAPSQPHYYREPRFQRQMSAGHEPVVNKATAAREEEGRKKKKPLIPLVGALFMRRKKSNNTCHDDSF